MRANTRRILAYELFLIPALLVYIIFFVYPMGSSMFYSFTSINFLRPAWHFLGIANYTRVFSDNAVMASIKNTVYFAFLSTIFINLLALFLAICFDAKFRGSNILRTLIFAPAVIGGLIVGYVWNFILSSSGNGLMNSFLSVFGVSPTSWFGLAKYAMNSIIFVYVWQWCGWCMVIYQANLQSIPEELYEAAEIDGANAVQRVFRITLPLMVTSVTINSVLFMISGLKVYDIVVATTKGGPGYSTETFTTMLMNRVFGMNQYGYGSAIAVIQFIVILLVTLAQMGVLNIWEKKVL